MLTKAAPKSTMHATGHALRPNICYPKARVMNTLLSVAMLVASISATSVVCQAQVYSSYLPAPHRADEVTLMTFNYSSGPYNTSVEWFVSTNKLIKQFRWDGLSAEVPLSARKACVLALPHVRERISGIQSWSVESVVMERLSLHDCDLFPNVWFYKITFAPRALEDRERADYQTNFCAATQIVLLDGTVLPQTLQKRK